MFSTLKSQFLLDPEVIYFNHGSFGACPRPVFDEYQRWQRELERQPVEFLGRRIKDLMADARQKLATFLGLGRDDLVFFPNPTTAINMVARSLRLQPGDEILATDHEYGAMDRTWRLLGKLGGYRYIRRPMALPITTSEQFIEDFWAGVTPRTKVIFLSHITSPTAVMFPVREICRRAREAGILTILDGAHAPGQIPLNLAEVGADIYSGAAHKWLLAPKGSAFLYARPEAQSWMLPLVVSWGFEADQPTGSPFVDYHEWQGTRDMAAFLATPAAIRFQAEHGWEEVRSACHALASQARNRINAWTGLPAICPDSTEWYSQMAAIRLPDVDCAALGARLYQEYRIEVPVFRWNDQPLLRLSVQGYNSQPDIDTLLEALQALL